MKNALTIGLQDSRANGKIPACEFAALIPLLDKAISQERIKQAQLVLVAGWTAERVSRMFDITPQAVRKSAVRVMAQHEEWLASLATLAACQQPQASPYGLALSFQIPDSALSAQTKAYIQEVVSVWR